MAERWCGLARSRPPLPPEALKESRRRRCSSIDQSSSVRSVSSVDRLCANGAACGRCGLEAAPSRTVQVANSSDTSMRAWGCCAVWAELRPAALCDRPAPSQSRGQLGVYVAPCTIERRAKEVGVLQVGALELCVTEIRLTEVDGAAHSASLRDPRGSSTRRLGSGGVSPKAVA